MREGLGIGEAIEAMRNGRKVTRHGWGHGAISWLELQTPDAHSKMTLPYLFLWTLTGQRVPWVASQRDLLADDWFVVE